MPDFSDQPASVAEYRSLRMRAGMRAAPDATVETGLKGTLHGVWLREHGELVGMGRVIGDGGCFAQVTDIVVDPACQGQGWGTKIVARIVHWCDTELPSGCFVSLIADAGAEGLYERAGFEFRTGMSRLIP